MKIQTLRPEGTEENGIHRELVSYNSNAFLSNKWEKDNLKFFGDIGSFPCLPSRSGGNPSTKDGRQWEECSLEMKVP
jgi:hypothetical protein